MEGSDTQDMMWGILLHISYNMWCDRDAPERDLTHYSYRPDLQFDEAVWDALLPQLVAAGINTVVLDLGDAILYDSHPEIAVEGAWTPAKLRQELAKLRSMGLEPLPKLNFSTAHDAWLGPYSRQVSSEPYYAVCRDLISEVIDLFDGPRLFHLGMDEETARHQRHYQYLVIRQYGLWWHDLLLLVDEVERGGARSWVWSDYAWDHPELFYARMPKSVLQSNWYYGKAFGPDLERVRTYDELEQHGYDQVPTGSNWVTPDNYPDTVRYCRDRIDPGRLKGFLQTVWRPTLPDCFDRHEEAIASACRAKGVYQSR